MQNIIYKCDVCGRQKGNTNHWWRARVGNALHVYHWEYFGESGEDDSIPTLHICSHECVHKAMDTFLSAPFGDARSQFDSLAIKVT